MKLTLESYQQDAVDWILSHPRCALFTSVGLGKTVTVLEAFEQLFIKNKVKNMLVVAPLRVAKWTWPMEIAKWQDYSWMKVCDLRDEFVPDCDVYTINYESLHKVPKNRHFSMVVFDELTKFKNSKGKRFKSFLPTLSKIGRRVGLTGTPCANSIADLHGQILALDDGLRLGKSAFQFRQRYFDQLDYMGYKWGLKSWAEEEINYKLSDLALVQSSEEFSDVADTELIDIDVPLGPHLKDYKELEKHMLLEIGNGTVTAANAAVLVNKLLQYTGGNLYDGEGFTHLTHDRKIEALRKLAAEHTPLLVAVNYVAEKEAIVKAIPGAEVWDEKTSLVRWNAGEIPILVAHPSSIGHGLNLQQGGHKVCWFSQPWSRELYIQFNARVARKGQGKRPMVFRLICPGTIDEAVVEALRSRGETESALLTAVRLLQS
jgi:hypothetical protein